MLSYVIESKSVDEIVDILTMFDPYTDKPYSFRDSENQKQWPEKLSNYSNSIVCYNEGLTVGTMFFYDNEIAAKNQEGYCVFFCVLPEYRRCGVASEIVKRVKAHLKNRGIANFKLKCAKCNIAALKLYLKSGFVIIDDDGRVFTMLSKT